MYKRAYVIVVWAVLALIVSFTFGGCGGGSAGTGVKRVSGDVRSLKSGEPVQDVTVAVSTPDGQVSEDAVTDEDGIFILDPIVAGQKLKVGIIEGPDPDSATLLVDVNVQYRDSDIVIYLLVSFEENTAVIDSIQETPLDEEGERNTPRNSNKKQADNNVDEDNDDQGDSADSGDSTGDSSDGKPKRPKNTPTPAPSPTPEATPTPAPTVEPTPTQHPYNPPVPPEQERENNPHGPAGGGEGEAGDDGEGEGSRPGGPGDCNPEPTPTCPPNAICAPPRCIPTQI